MINYSDTKWLNLSQMDNSIIKTLPNEKNKNISKSKNKDNNNTSLTTQRVKVNISKKKSNLNTSKPKKTKYLENKLRNCSPNNLSSNVRKINEKKDRLDYSEQRRFSQLGKKLRYNKSCEDNIQINNEKNIFYNSMINLNNINNNFEPIITDYQNNRKKIDKKNLSNTDLNLKRNYSNKKNKFSKENNEIEIIKNLKVNNTTNNVKLIKKLEDNFQLIEDKIIDKNFEKDIAQDDLILSQKIKEESTTFENKIEDFSSFDSINSFILENKNNEKNDLEDTGNINLSYENIKNDFFIFYTHNYFNDININMIKLEFQLFLEKFFDLQSLYHNKLNYHRNQNYLTKKILQCFIDKFVVLNKKKHKLICKFDVSKIKNNFKNFVNSYKSQNDNELILNNKNECILWKNIFNGIEKKNIMTKEIFKIIVLDKYNNIKLLLNDKQKKICENLLNKFNNNIIKRKEEKKLTSKKSMNKKNKSNNQLIKSPNQNSTKNLLHLKSFNNLNKNQNPNLNNIKNFNSTMKISKNNNKKI